MFFKKKDLEIDFKSLQKQLFEFKLDKSNANRAVIVKQLDRVDNYNFSDISQEIIVNYFPNYVNKINNLNSKYIFSFLEDLATYNCDFNAFRYFNDKLYNGAVYTFLFLEDVEKIRFCRLFNKFIKDTDLENKYFLDKISKVDLNNVMLLKYLTREFVRKMDIEKSVDLYMETPYLMLGQNFTDAEQLYMYELFEDKDEFFSCLNKPSCDVVSLYIATSGNCVYLPFSSTVLPDEVIKEAIKINPEVIFGNHVVKHWERDYIPEKQVFFDFATKEDIDKSLEINSANIFKVPNLEKDEERNRYRIIKAICDNPKTVLLAGEMLNIYSIDLYNLALESIKKTSLNKDEDMALILPYKVKIDELEEVKNKNKKALDGYKSAVKTFKINDNKVIH